MELVTTHVHTTFCNHADGSIAEMADAARRAGISTMAFTEHYPLTHAFDPVERISMRPERVGDYLAAIEEARAACPGMEILSGCELDWLGDTDDRGLSAGDFAQFELILGSVHYIDGWGIDDKSRQDVWDEAGVDAIWRRYFELWCEACMSDWPFTVMSHPDLVKKYGHKPSFDPLPLYRKAAEAAAVGGRMVEVNTSGAHYACAEMFPSPEFLRELCRAGVPCTVGTDAHTAAHVARGIEDAYQAMSDAGYRCVTVPCRDGGRREIALG